MQEHLHWNRARISFIVAFVLALMKVTTVNLTKVAKALGGTAKKQANYRRIQRCFAGLAFDYNAWAERALRLVPVETDFVISIDRTNWRFGRFEINILMAGLGYQGTAYPWVWRLLAKTGSSNTAERTALIERLLSVLPAALIKAVVADREFIGKQWLITLDAYRFTVFASVRMPR